MYTDYAFLPIFYCGNTKMSNEFYCYGEYFPETSHVNLTIYSIPGQSMATLVATNINAGIYPAVFLMYRISLPD